MNNQDVDVLEFEPNLKPIKFNDITTINIAQQEQINLKDRINDHYNKAVKDYGYKFQNAIREYGIENLILNGKGIYLHAYSLSFIHPFTEEFMYVKDDTNETRLPKKFYKLFNPTK